jgi:hypothetical protein
MGYKSRGNFRGCCVKDNCINRDKKCNICIKWDQYISSKEVNMEYNGKNDTVECPECGEPMDEVWQSFCDADDNEAEGIVGYECECGFKCDTHGEVI